ncbi:MAG TPA: Sec-independent protein translocase protein TatB [Chloroflexota bacterium]|nr:Sec-independent protein translocase protein TatB [Chloroflexota bacterium]
MELFGIGLPELLLIMVLALVVIGPERLPEVASQLGRTMAELKRQANQLTAEFQQSMEIAAQERKDQRIGATAPLAARYCGQCGAAAPAEARFCSSCGASLGERVPDGERRD